MHPADIKAALEKRGLTQTAIAEELGLNPTTVSQIIHGRGISRRIAVRIADEIGKQPSQIWPGRYPELHNETA